MAKEIKIFENPKFGNVRIHMNASGEPMFCLADVAEALDIKNSRDLKSRLNQKGVALTDTPTNGGIQQLVFINEGNLYKCVFKSRRPDAEEFQDWVCDEVIPSIRKTGSYSTMPPAPALPQNYLEALKALVAAEEEKIQLQLANQSMKPKAEYFDSLVERNLLTNFRDTAKQLHIPQNTLIELLITNKFIYRDKKGTLKPYSEYTPEYFEMKDYSYNGHAGVQTLVTPKGKEAFRLMWGGGQYAAQ